MRLPHVLTVLTPTYTTDVLGNTEVKDWDAATKTVERGFWQPKAGEENESAGDVQQWDAVVFLPVSTVADGTCRIQYNGDDFEVIGPPEVWSSGSSLDHAKAKLRRITG